MFKEGQSPIADEDDGASPHTCWGWAVLPPAYYLLGVSQPSHATSSCVLSISSSSPLRVSIAPVETVCTSLWLAGVVCASGCVRACAFECVRGSAWHKPSSSDIHVNPHTTSAPPPLKGTVNRHAAHGMSRFTDWTIAREKNGRVWEAARKRDMQKSNNYTCMNYQRIHVCDAIKLRRKNIQL